jgi:hypothetical protein
MRRKTILVFKLDKITCTVHTKVFKCFKYSFSNYIHQCHRIKIGSLFHFRIETNLTEQSITKSDLYSLGL